MEEAQVARAGQLPGGDYRAKIQCNLLKNMAHMRIAIQESELMIINSYGRVNGAKPLVTRCRSLAAGDFLYI